MAIIFFELALIIPNLKLGRPFNCFDLFGDGYELAQFFSPRSVLDWRDMIATLIPV